ncbi:hypothetical protein Syun_015343 [Stephania yunnanensis]|uniref:EF-hand domain-containing protein n=1 Tax=Stephania yunnanensis TaxID=152371 RepID=A0AAP0P998_9MAGN
MLITKEVDAITEGDFKKWLMGFDKNNDGLISKSELREALRSSNHSRVRFAWLKGRLGMRAADLNRDGFIDDSETRALAEYAREHWGFRIIIVT